MKLHSLLNTLALVALVSTDLQAASPKTLELRQGDHICLIGNTTAERMQFEGHNHWETFLYQRFPKLNLVVRNLSWSADEVVLRPRAEGFGEPDEHLRFSKADVVIGFFGFNESFQGEKGLPQFRKDLEAWIQHTKSQDYSGKGAPRIALVSPLAAENLNSPHLPDGKEINQRLALYVAAMKEVAAAHEVVFADVFEPMKKVYAMRDPAWASQPGVRLDYTPSGELFRPSKWPPIQIQPPSTINGVHLTRAGDFYFGLVLQDLLFGQLPGKLEYNAALLSAIEDKNLHWYNRYRIVDSYYVYGGRSGLKFADGDQTNRDVMQREREVLDVMVANRDQRIWALASGKTVSEKVDDSNVPPFLEVKTWFGIGRKTDAGKNTGQTSKTAEGSSAIIPSVEETKKQFQLANGFAVECFASEETFPELANATSMQFDSKGRLWVTTMPSYPQWRPGDAFTDKIIILEDSDGDGKANYCTTFADQLHLPLAMSFYDGGVLVSAQRNLMFLKDTDNDDKADIREIVLSGFDSADSHHVINAFTSGPGGDLYFQEGTFHHSQVETPYGPVRCKNAGTYRYEPRTQKLSVFVSYNYANPHGIAFDQHGQTFIADASGGMNYFATAFSGFLPYPDKHNSMQTFFPKRVRPTSGCEFVYSRQFPDEMQGNFLINNCIGVQGTLNHTMKAVGSGYEGTEIEPLSLNTETNYRPVDLKFGPDGALYVVDWSEALIGHMQYSLRDPLRDHKFGRIWKFWNTAKPLLKPAKIAGESLPVLLELLKEPEYRTRERVKVELDARPTQEVVKALAEWLPKQTDEMLKLEALWIQQWHHALDAELLKSLLSASKAEVRAAAVRVLCYHHEVLPDTLARLKTAANDASPLVRLEAVRACSFYGEEPALAGTSSFGKGRQEAVNVALQVLNHEMDYYLTYTLGETMRALKPSPAEIDIKANPAALAYVLEKMTPDELKNAPREIPVLEALLEREGIDLATRAAAAQDLAKKRNTTPEKELISAVFRLDEQNRDASSSADLGRMLAMATPEALKKAEESIARMGSKDHGVRSARVAGMAAWVTLRGGPESIWTSRADNHETLSVLCDALPLLSAPALRAKYQPLIKELLKQTNLPTHLRQSALRGLALTGPENAADSFALLADAIIQGQERETAANAMMQLPRQAWNKQQAQEIAESILAYAKTVPTHQRSQQGYVELSQLGLELCALLDANIGSPIRKQLRQLGVAVFVIKTVREQMRYDTTELTVEAGKPFEIIFENVDALPHNLIFVQPGLRAEIGNAAQAMPMTPNKEGYLYVPDHKGIWGKSHMMEPGQKERLQLVAPTTPGDDYEYVCTFPGHWLIMWGKLKVVKELD